MEWDEGDCRSTFRRYTNYLGNPHIPRVAQTTPSPPTFHRVVEMIIEMRPTFSSCLYPYRCITTHTVRHYT